MIRRPASVRCIPRLMLSLAFGWVGAAGLRAGPAPDAKIHARAAAPAVDEIHGTLNLGASMTERGDYAAAEIAYRQVLAAAGTDLAATKAALLGLAHMHRKQGALTKAAAIYQKYLQEYPGDDHTPDVLLDLGRILRSMGAYKSAISDFYSVINSTLKLPAKGFDHYQQLAKTAQFEIAETHFVAGDFAEAGRFFSRLRLLDLAPADQARAHFMTACSQQLQGDCEGAVTTLRSYLEQWPDDENVPEARHLLALSLRQLNRPQEAFTATLELLRTEKSRIKTDPKRWAYWQRLTGNQLANDFFENGDILNAQAIYTGLAALSDDPTWRLPVSYQIALCDERLGAINRARTAYQAIMDATQAEPSANLAELGRMAAWRLGHLDWHDTVDHQLAAIFVTTTGRPPADVHSKPAPTPP